MEHLALDEVSIPRHEIDRRIASVRRRMAGRGLEVLVVFSSPGSLRFGQRGHVLYLSGYEPYFGDCMMILPLDDTIDAVLVKDAADYFPQTCTWIADVRGAGDRVKVVGEFLSDNGLERSSVGVAGEYSVSPALYVRLLEEVGPARLEIASDILEHERSVKSEFELECLKKAAAIAGKGLEAAARFMRPGVTESDVKGEMERVCRAHGSQAFPHYTMVVSGRDEAYASCWWQCERRMLESGDPVSIDFGTMYQGYCCDLSRPFVLGRASERQKDVLKVLLEAHHAAAAAARPGVHVSTVDAAANKILTAAWGDRDWWGIGHGVGLEVHEWPFIGYQRIVDDGAYEDRVLEEHTVISLEPTMALPDTGDLQIEDQFVVKEGGAVRLNGIPHEISEV
jgi:Xaa-Pro aminopeptidase